MKTVEYWFKEIDACKKREKDFRKEGERIIEICEGQKKEETPFNIGFSNTETLLPALYSATPRPIVTRRFKDDDPIGKAAAVAGERVLTFLIDTNIEGYETFDDAMGAATYDALVPGRGLTSVKYDAEEGELAGDEPSPYKKSELVCADTTDWKRVYFGYAKKWSRVPFIVYQFDMDREECVEKFGAEIANALKYTAPEKTDDDHTGDDDKGETKTTCIYQVWEKATKTVIWLSEQVKDKPLKVEDDPLELTGFYNCPRPLQFIERTGNLNPVAPYLLYENQASELNELTRRINRIVKAIKARGVYDSSLGSDIENLMDGEDNELVPADKAASLSAEGGLDKAIWFMPVEQLVIVLRELYVAREACKQVIFEIMGLADIMRGSSQASETLGAQQIKQNWGSLKLKRKQKEVQRYARDLLRMMLEIAAKKFSEETWAQMTGLPYLTEAKFAELTQVAQALQMQIPPQMPGQPPQPNPMQDQLAQVQQQLQSPKWSDVLQTLKNDLQRAYRIDIETNSTVEPEAVEDQKNITDVMTAIGQALNGVSPLVQQGIMPFQVAQSMLLMIAKRYRFGGELEDIIKNMQQPKPPDDGKAQAAQQQAMMDKQAHDADMQAKQLDIAAKEKENATKAATAERQAQLDQEKMARQAQYDAAEHAMKMAEIAAKTRMNEIVTASKIRIAEATAKQREAQAKEPASPQ